MVYFLLSKRAKIDCKNMIGQTPLDLIGNINIYKIYVDCFGEDKLKEVKSPYSRLVMNNYVFHNNRADNIREIIAKCENYKQRKNLFNLDRINNLSEFKVIIVCDYITILLY